MSARSPTNAELMFTDLMARSSAAACAGFACQKRRLRALRNDNGVRRIDLVEMKCSVPLSLSPHLPQRTPASFLPSKSWSCTALVGRSSSSSSATNLSVNLIGCRTSFPRRFIVGYAQSLSCSRSPIRSPRKKALFPPADSDSQPCCPSPRTERKCSSRSAEPWYVFKLVYDLVCAAVLPLALCDATQALGQVVAHIRRANERGTRPRQLDRLSQILFPP